jgi:hypothetical protein
MRNSLMLQSSGLARERRRMMTRYHPLWRLSWRLSGRRTGSLADRHLAHGANSSGRWSSAVARANFLSRSRTTWSIARGSILRAECTPNSLRARSHYAIQSILAISSHMMCGRTDTPQRIAMKCAGLT